MGSDFAYDPVTSLEETSATGPTAELFADIRTTMGIPLLTSIWRALADMDGALGTVWALTKPIYESGQVSHALARVLDRAQVPKPIALTPTQLGCIGIDPAGLRDIRAIVAAYNRSNGMNLIALAALVTPPGADRPDSAAPDAPPRWPTLRPLLQRADIDDRVWDMVRHVNAFGAPGPDAFVATLWRHLAHWPGLLALLHAAFAPLQAAGAIQHASARVVSGALMESARLAHLRSPQVDLPDAVRTTIEDYVREPTHVARMVVLGRMLERWVMQ